MNRALAALIGGLWTTFVGGTRLFVLAPLIPLLVIVPEFAQHIAEIRLGMFDDREAFIAGANTPERWAFGYAKIAGFLVAILAAARFWGQPGRRWWDLRGTPWGALLLGLALNIAVGLPFELLRGRIGESAFLVSQGVVSIVSLPLLLYLLGALFGDRTMTLRAAYTRGWRRIPLLVVLLAAAVVPAQIVHQLNHTWALGRPETVAWALMAWDSLLVGLLACWTGSALAAGYRGGDATSPDCEPLPIQ